MRLKDCVAVIALSWLSACVAVAQGVSFRTEVMAVLSKAGCNAGACHGNANGKGGFKLSLRGEDPERDFQVLTRDLFSRRIDVAEPAQSLLLLKPTTQVAHEGGRRFDLESREYELLRRWIAAGGPDDARTVAGVADLEVSPHEALLFAPTNRVQLKVTARFADGSTRDVTDLAVFELTDTFAKTGPSGSVTMNRPGETTVIVRYLTRQQPTRITLVPDRPYTVARDIPRRNYIDDQILSKQERLRITPSPLCTDSEFVRRIYLDLLGMLPTADEAIKFIGDRRDDKRARLATQLQRRPEFADFWALKWADLLRNEEKVLDRKGVQAFHRWIRDSIATNQGLDRFAAEILSAHGSSYDNPAANFMRALRDPVKRAEATAQVFLGTRLQCAQCHNHPFDRWTQNDYYSWAAAFAPVSYKVIENNRRDRLDTHEFNGEQIIFASTKPRVNNPRTGKAATARVLGESPLVEKATGESLAQWLVKNPQFARAQVNRIWSYLMGRGLVDPIDDFRITNPASHPELLEQLTSDFIKHGFDLRYLVSLITASSAYQLSSEPNDSNGEDAINYSRVIPRRVAAEQLIDAQHQVLGVAQEFSGYPVGMRACQIPGVIAARGRRQQQLSVDDQMLRVFGKPQRLLTCECERSNETSMSQAFQLIGGPAMHELLSKPNNRLQTLLDSKRSSKEMVSELYWAALSRPPSDAELASAVHHIEQAKTPRSGLEDAAWALLNAKEFILRR